MSLGTQPFPSHGRWCAAGSEYSSTAKKIRDISWLQACCHSSCIDVSWSSSHRCLLCV